MGAKGPSEKEGGYRMVAAVVVALIRSFHSRKNKNKSMIEPYYYE